MVEKKIFAGLSVYHHDDFSDWIGKIDALIEAINSITSNKIIFYRFSRSADAKQTRSKRYSKKNIGTDFLLGKYHSVSLFDKEVLSSIDSLVPDHLHITLFLEKTHSGLYKVEIESTDQILIAKLPTILDGMIQGIVYGYVYLSEDWKDAFQHMSLVPVSSSEGNSEIEEKLKLKLWSFQEKESMIGEGVLSAFWGNFLSEKHIGRLGGIDAVHKNAPAQKIIRTKGGIYIQLTNEPHDCLNSEYKNNLRKLHKYFISIIL